MISVGNTDVAKVLTVYENFSTIEVI